MNSSGQPWADFSNSRRASAKQRKVFPHPAGPNRNRVCTSHFRECRAARERLISPRAEPREDLSRDVDAATMKRNGRTMETGGSRSQCAKEGANDGKAG